MMKQVNKVVICNIMVNPTKKSQVLYIVNGEVAGTITVKATGIIYTHLTGEQFHKGYGTYGAAEFFLEKELKSAYNNQITFNHN